MLSSALIAQEYITRKDADKKALKYFEEARSALNNSDKEAALEALDKSLKKEPAFVDALLMKADLWLQLKNYASAEETFEKALTIAPDYAPLALLFVAEAEFEQQKYDEAIAHAQQYLKEGKPSERRQQKADKMLKNAQFALRALKTPLPFQPQSLGPNINTARPEYLPSLTADGRFLVYTSRTDGKREDIFFSERRDTGWTTGVPLESLNSPFNDSSPAIAANGKAMAFARDNRDGNFDLFFAEKIRGQWQEPKRIPAPVSTAHWESQPSLSADGQTLYFVSDRPGGKGKLDLWVSHRQEDGSWGQVANLGSRINTSYNEQAPFIHPDGQTLYFMSKGHPGMGEYDLFLSRKDETGEWNEPENLGYPINTQYNEGALAISLDGKTAYFDTDKFGPTGEYQEMGNADLFSFNLPANARPMPATYVQATVRDAESRAPLTAEVSFIRLRDNEQHIRAETDEEGQFLTVLPLGENYALNVSKKNYLFHSENFALEAIQSIDKPFMLDILLHQIPDSGTPMAGTPIVLKNVFFDTGSADLLPTSVAELQQLKQLLVDQPGLRIQINGHTDNVGSPDDNQLLSEKRAQAVYNYLIQSGIAAERLQYKGFGERRPIADNGTSEGRQLNRRTEFEVVDNR
jgi:outer membrane protein OmpA-like peptidoglycan-associated protein/tetratricopeptide (TPR) repeat protein